MNKKSTLTVFITAVTCSVILLITLLSFVIALSSDISALLPSNDANSDIGGGTAIEFAILTVVLIIPSMIAAGLFAMITFGLNFTILGAFRKGKNPKKSICVAEGVLLIIAGVFTAIAAFIFIYIQLKVFNALFLAAALIAVAGGITLTVIAVKSGKGISPNSQSSNTENIPVCQVSETDDTKQYIYGNEESNDINKN